MRKGHVYTLTLLTALTAGSMTAGAQDTEFSREVKLAGITQLISHDIVPVGFDPLTAAADQLQELGFPMRPDPSETKAYAMWVRAVSATRVRGEYINTGRHHQPNQTRGTANATDEKGVALSGSGNWSGYAITGGSAPFVQVSGRWTVPDISNEAGIPSNGYMSTWVGIDGDCKCNDLIQDGTEQDWVNGATRYDAWVEFIPEPELVQTSVPIKPGDVIFAYSWVTEKSGVIYGNYYLVNDSTGKAFSTTLKIPPSTKFSGLSAEWIVERTEIGSSFQNPMPHYAYDYMDDAFAWRNGGSSFAYTKEVNQNICMLSTGGSCKASAELSIASELGSDSILFQWVNY